MSILTTENLTKSFGGLTAVDNVQLQVDEKCITSIIGPNGAGKTTFFNLITGVLKPDSGKIFYDSEDITNLPIHKRVRKGISRSFQILNLFDELSVEENIWVGVQAQQGHGRELLSDLDKFPQVKEKTGELLSIIGLLDRKTEPVKYLPYGNRRRLEIALSLTREPKLLLLDEPMSGLGADDRPQIAQFIHDLAKRLTIIVVEHDMDIVMSISHSIVVMHQGQILATGSPEEVKQNEEVQNAYLGGMR
jgi:branched-chain amino acid transport system ATP-binding protein